MIDNFKFFNADYKVHQGRIKGGGEGAGRGEQPPSQGFDPLLTQIVPPLVLLKKFIFGQPTLKFF